MSGAVLGKQNAIERSCIAVRSVDMDIHVSSGKKRLGVLSYQSLQWTCNVSQCLFEQGYMRKRERECYYRQTLLGFFLALALIFHPVFLLFNF